MIERRQLQIHANRCYASKFPRMHLLRYNLDLWQTSHVWSCLCSQVFRCDKIQTCIQVWNLRQGKCIRTLLGHQGPVWTIVLRGSTLLSASQDNTVSVVHLSILLSLNLCNSIYYEAIFHVSKFQPHRPLLVFMGG